MDTVQDTKVIPSQPFTLISDECEGVLYDEQHLKPAGYSALVQWASNTIGLAIVQRLLPRITPCDKCGGNADFNPRFGPWGVYECDKCGHSICASYIVEKALNLRAPNSWLLLRSLAMHTTVIWPMPTYADGTTQPPMTVNEMIAGWVLRNGFYKC